MNPGGHEPLPVLPACCLKLPPGAGLPYKNDGNARRKIKTVSYTHLTLPTIYSV